MVHGCCGSGVVCPPRVSPPVPYSPHPPPNPRRRVVGRSVSEHLPGFHTQPVYPRSGSGTATSSQLLGFRPEGTLTQLPYFPAAAESTFTPSSASGENPAVYPPEPTPREAGGQPLPARTDPCEPANRRRDRSATVPNTGIGDAVDRYRGRRPGPEMAAWRCAGTHGFLGRVSPRTRFPFAYAPKLGAPSITTDSSWPCVLPSLRSLLRPVRCSAPFLGGSASFGVLSRIVDRRGELSAWTARFGLLFRDRFGALLSMLVG